MDSGTVLYYCSDQTFTLRFGPIWDLLHTITWTLVKNAVVGLAQFTYIMKVSISTLETMSQTSPQCTYRVLPLLEYLDATFYISMH